MFNWVGSSTWLDLELVYKPSQRSHGAGYWTSHRLVGSSCWHFEAERHHQGNGADSPFTFPWNELLARVCPGVQCPLKIKGDFFWWFDDFSLFFAVTRSAPENQRLEGDSLPFWVSAYLRSCYRHWPRKNIKTLAVGKTPFDFWKISRPFNSFPRKKELLFQQIRPHPWNMPPSNTTLSTFLWCAGHIFLHRMCFCWNQVNGGLSKVWHDDHISKKIPTDPWDIPQIWKKSNMKGFPS